MSPELIEEVKRRIAELEPKERSQYSEVQRLEAEVKEFSKPYDLARDQWVDLFTELKNLKSMLPPEVQTEEPKQTIPF